MAMIDIGLRVPDNDDEGWVDRQMRISDIMADGAELRRIQRRRDALLGKGRPLDTDTEDQYARLTRAVFHGSVEFLVDYVGALDGEAVDPNDEDDRLRIVKALRRCSETQYQEMIAMIQQGKVGDKSLGPPQDGAGAVIPGRVKGQRDRVPALGSGEPILEQPARAG